MGEGREDVEEMGPSGPVRSVGEQAHVPKEVAEANEGREVDQEACDDVCEGEIGESHEALDVVSVEEPRQSDSGT